MYPYWTWFGYATNESVNGFQLRYLPINFAFLLLDRRLGSHPTTVEKYSLNDVGIYTDSSHCVSCPFTLIERINIDENEDLLDDYYVWKMATVGYRKWRILGSSLQKYNNDVGDMICEFEPELGEFGVYKIDLDECQLKKLLEPINIYFQLILFCFLLSISGIFMKKFFMKQIEKQIALRNSPAKDEAPSVDEVVKPRIETGWLSSLYIFRGCLLYIMMFLSTGGGGYYLFTRSMGGLTLVECVFFAYIWTVGFKLPITMNRVFERENLKLQAFVDVSKIAGLLVILGLVSECLFQSRFEKQSIALWASLQRLGFSYFFVGTAYIFTAKRFETYSKNILCKAYANFKSIFWCWVIAGCLFILQIISINFIISFDYRSPVDEEISNTIITTTEATYDYIEEDEKSDNSSKVFDFAGFYNKVLIASHVTMPYDNYVGFSKGLMGFLTTTIFCIIGVTFGTIYLQNERSKDKLKLWGLWTAILGIAGVALAVMSVVLQLKLWPFATTFLLATWTAIFFLIFYVLVESTKKVHFPLIRRTGAVSMALFVGHVIVSRFFPLNWKVNFKSHLMYLFQNFLVILHWFTIGIFLSIKNFRFGMEL